MALIRYSLVLWWRGISCVDQCNYGRPTGLFVGLPPGSGNEDEQYVEHTFLPGTVLVAGGGLYVSPSVRRLRSRSASPIGSAGQP